MNYGIHTNDPSHIIEFIKLATKLKCNSIQIFLGDRIKTTLKYKHSFSCFVAKKYPIIPFV